MVLRHPLSRDGPGLGRGRCDSLVSRPLAERLPAPGEEEDRALGMRPEQQPQPEHKPVKASGATAFPAPAPDRPWLG